MSSQSGSIWHSRCPRYVPPSEWSRIASGTARPGAHYTADCSADGSVLLIADDTATV